MFSQRRIIIHLLAKIVVGPVMVYYCDYIHYFTEILFLWVPPFPQVLVCWFNVLYLCNLITVILYCTTLTVRNVHICIDECNMTCVISPPGNGGAIYHFHNTPLMFTRATIGTNYSGGAIEGVISNRREYSSRSAMICVMTHLTPV